MSPSTGFQLTWAPCEILIISRSKLYPSCRETKFPDKKTRLIAVSTAIYYNTEQQGSMDI